MLLLFEIFVVNYIIIYIQYTHIYHNVITWKITQILVKQLPPFGRRIQLKNFE